MGDSEEPRPCQALAALHNVNTLTGVTEKSGKGKNSLLDYFHPRESEQKKKVQSKSTQVNSTWITEEDITSDGPSENFWQNVAEKRRVALEESLVENERLNKVCESMRIKHNHVLALLEEASSFVESIIELVHEEADDTGIDIEDLVDLDTTAEAD